jgi:murE/murF fusion protein
MLLKDYFPNLNKKYHRVSFKGIALNSKKIKKGYIFFAFKGNNTNGNLFINDAIKNGSKIIISDKLKKNGWKKDILFLRFKYPRKLLALFSSRIFNKKPNNLIAVTGTNGKSSVANFYFQIASLNKVKAASIGTLGINGLKIKKNFSNTTFDPIQINNILQKLKQKKIDNVILEASSHGLNQNRLYGLKFDVGIFTNLSRDHLDYHKTFQNYLNSKLILFRKLMKKNSCAIYDDKLKIASNLNRITKSNKIKKFTIGSSASSFVILNHQFLKDEQKVIFKFNNKKYSFSTKLIGRVQIKNLLMAIMAAINSKISLEKILKITKKIKPVNGRLEKIGRLNNNGIVILDYAHTPDALETCIKDIKEQFKLRKINLVFGCGGDRDKPKRKIMGRIANKYCNKIYLTDDNPRNEDPKIIRRDVKSNILKNKLLEIPSREKAIKSAIMDIKSNEVVIIAGKGHEVYQEYAFKKYFSDKNCIKKYIKERNKTLNKNWKSNIISEVTKKKIEKNIKINEASIDSRKIKKNNIFFGIKGKNFDGNKFAHKALWNGASFSIIEGKLKNKIKNKIYVKNSLKIFSESAKLVRISSSISSVAITGSAGKTSLKEMLGQMISKLCQTSYSKKSFNNKYGVPISLFNINEGDKIGIFEVGMNKKGEIDLLTKNILPNIGVITNISYAHIENFKNLKSIAQAKSEIINNIVENGTIILNADDQFFNFFKSKAKKKKLRIISFGIKNKSNLSLIKIKNEKNNCILFINYNNSKLIFSIKKNLENYIYNILSTLAVISVFFDLHELNKFFFNDYKFPEGRGDIKLINLKEKKINLIDESYNSNPLSLKFALNKLNNLNAYSKRKLILLGDMLELGKHSKKFHREAAEFINHTEIDKVYVYGKDVIETFNKIRPQKRGKILNSKEDILNFMIKDIKNGEYLMIKGSNSTGLNRISQNLKKGKLNAF